MALKLPYDFKADLWCFGVLLVEMLFGRLPFEGEGVGKRDYTRTISSLEYKLPENTGVSKEAYDLIKNLLVV